MLKQTAQIPVLFLLFFLLMVKANGQHLLKDSIPSLPVDTSQIRHYQALLGDSTLLPINPLNALKPDSTALANKKKNILPDSSRLTSLKKPELPFHKKMLPGKLPGDSLLKRKNTFKTFKQKNNISGTVNAGYDYGVIPFANTFKVPTGYFKSDGYATFDLAGLPLNASYFYSTLKNISGLNNYFKVSFDATRFKEKLNRKMTFDEKEMQDSLTGLYKSKLPYEKKMYYLQAKLKALEAKNPLLHTYTLPDSIAMPALPGNAQIPGMPGYNGPEIDSAAAVAMLKDSLNRYVQANQQLQQADSLRRELQAVKGRIDHYLQLIESTKKTIDTYKALSASDYTDVKRDIPSYQQFFSHVKTLDVGLCYPNYSTFLVSGTALKGVNFEYSKHSWYTAFTYGKTVNNLLFTNNQVQNTLQNVKNLYNFFDFNSAKDARKIVAFKTGYGEKENTHIYAGFLYGIGRVSYMNEQSGSNAVERNYAFELDGRLRVHRNHYFDLVYGKSYLSSENESSSLSYGFNHIFSSARSNAFMGKYNGTIEKTKTNIILSSRWIDPLFKSFGVGFMRSDNFRYEARVEQRLGSKVKVNAFFRNDRDNLLNLYYYTTHLRNFGTQVSVKLSKGFTVKVGYNPVIQHVNSRDGKYKLTNTNNISNLLLSYSCGIHKVRMSFSLMYNQFDLSSDTIMNSRFKSISFINNTSFSQRVKNNISASWFRTSQTDSLNNNTLLLSDELGFLIGKKIALSVGAKAAHNPGFDWQFGYLLRYSMPLVKNTALEISAEKLVLGDFYNSYNYQQIKSFPYFGSAKLIVNF